MDFREERARRNGIAEQEKIDEGGIIQRKRPSAQLLERFDLRCKAECPVERGIVQGLDSGSVSCKKQLVLHRVIHRQRKHAVELRQAGGPPIAVRFEEHFRIGLRAKPFSNLFELLPEPVEIINFTVIDHDVALVGRTHGLLSSGRIDHCQARMSQPNCPR